MNSMTKHLKKALKELDIYYQKKVAEELARRKGKQIIYLLFVQQF